MSGFNQFVGNGHRPTLDDFGTGYSSLSLLQRLPVKNLKIDKSFVQKKMSAREKNLGIVKGMINLAHDHNITVVAEGVDDAQALKVLKDCRCDHFQGYLFSKPVKKESVIPLLRENSQVNQGCVQLEN